MMKKLTASLAAGLFAVVFGALGGEALALQVQTPGAQIPHPIARPALGVYVLPLAYMPGDTITSIEIGRDDAMPYASFTLQFAPGAPNLVPPFNVFAPGGAFVFTYRPYWDSALYPTLTGPTGVPIVGRADEQWSAIDKFASAVQNLRALGAAPALPPPAAVFWIDFTAVGAGTILDTEFYKYWVRY